MTLALNGFWRPLNVERSRVTASIGKADREWFIPTGLTLGGMFFDSVYFETYCWLRLLQDVIEWSQEE